MGNIMVQSTPITVSYSQVEEIRVFDLKGKYFGFTVNSANILNVNSSTTLRGFWNNLG
jgi:hypothetical protein